MWHDGRRFRKDLIDKTRRTCNSSIACMVKEEGQLVDQVGILEDIIEIEFPRIPNIILFKGKWFKNNVRWNDCLLYSINNTEFYTNDTLKDQPFVYPTKVEQVFFPDDFLNTEWTFVLQDKPRNFMVFQLIEPMVWDDGRDVRGSESGPPLEGGIPMVDQFNIHSKEVEENVDDTFNEYDSGSDDEEMRLRGIEDLERHLDETSDDFEGKDSDYESRRMRSLSELL
jgi:hypothetical protein